MMFGPLPPSSSVTFLEATENLGGLSGARKWVMPGCRVGLLWDLCKCPGAVAGAGEPEVDQSAEVEGGGPVVEPGVVLGDAAVGDAAVAAGDEPGDGPLDWGTPSAVFGLPGRVGGGAAGGGQEGVLGVDAEDSPGLGGGAALAQRAAAAQDLELGQAGAVGVGAAQGDGVPGRAGDRAGPAVDGEVVNGEAAGDGLPQRGRFDHQRVAVCREVFTQLAGAISGAAEDG